MGRSSRPSPSRSPPPERHHPARRRRAARDPAETRRGPFLHACPGPSPRARHGDRARVQRGRLHRRDDSQSARADDGAGGDHRGGRLLHGWHRRCRPRDGRDRDPSASEHGVQGGGTELRPRPGRHAVHRRGRRRHGTRTRRHRAAVDRFRRPPDGGRLRHRAAAPREDDVGAWPLRGIPIRVQLLQAHPGPLRRTVDQLGVFLHVSHRGLCGPPAAGRIARSPRTWI